MDRRSFLQRLGFGVAAAPIAAPELAELATRSDMAYAGLRVGFGAADSGASPVPPVAEVPTKTIIKGLRKQIRDLYRPAERRRRVLQRSVTIIPPDISALRSVSMTAKFRMARDEAIARDIETERGYLDRQIRRLLAGKDRYDWEGDD